MKADRIGIWIKASERLPDMNEKVDIKVDDIFYYGRISFFKDDFVKRAVWLEEKQNVYVFTEEELKNILVEYKNAGKGTTGINVIDFLKSKFPTP